MGIALNEPGGFVLFSSVKKISFSFDKKVITIASFSYISTSKLSKYNVPLNIRNLLQILHPVLLETSHRLKYTITTHLFDKKIGPIPSRESSHQETTNH